jgi:hypothetical protein
MKNPLNRRLYRIVTIPILLFCLTLALPGTLLAGNILDKTGNPTATPLVAFSLRQLSSAYTGNLIQVRRSSDNVTKDIGFTAAGDLDTASLKAFVGSNTGYVSIWYDQSGNGYNATQTTMANQPTIIIGGLINRDNGQPSVYTSGTGFLTYGPISQLSGTTQVTRMEVCRSRDGSILAITEGLGTYQLDLQFFPTKIWVQFETGNIVANAPVSNPTTLMSINSVRNNGASLVYVNTTLLGSATAPIMNFSAPVTGYIGVRFDYQASGTAQPGAFSETMLFNSVLPDSDRQAINYNESWYYSLGHAPCSSTRASLPPNNTTSKALYACTLANWDYYYDPAHPLNLLFGIAKDPGNTGANPTFVVDSINLTATADPTHDVLDALSSTDGITALGRYWNVYTHTPLTSPVNISFFYAPADTLAARQLAHDWQTVIGASMVSNLQWFKTIGDPYTPDSLTATPTATVKGPFANLTPIYNTMNGVNYAEFDGVTSFSGVSGGTGVYIVSNTMVALPVIIDPFTARRVNGTTALSWTTQSESNSWRFEIERSTDGKAWMQVGELAAAGYSSTALSYQFTDVVSLQEGNSLYYRLRLEDRDEKYTYSGVVLIKSYDNDNATVTPLLTRISPNPFGSEMEITCAVPANGPVEVLLRDMAGGTVIHREYTADKGENVWRLTDLNGLAQGVYIVQVLQEGRIVGIGKVIKRL